MRSTIFGSHFAPLWRLHRIKVREKFSRPRKSRFCGCLVAIVCLCASSFGCSKSRSHELAHAPDGTPFSKSAYDRGRLDARKDLNGGRLALEEYGFPRPEENRYTEILRNKYGITVRRVATDVLDPATYGHALGYNEVMKAEARRRFGVDVVTAAKDEAVAPLPKSSN